MGCPGVNERHPDGFLKANRAALEKRSASERRQDFLEIYAPRWLEPKLAEQANRCMDCGVPMCMSACPLGNRIPEWNDCVASKDWHAAFEILSATNNFPEFTGYTCPAPCEPGCTLAIGPGAVTIKDVERAIIDHAWNEGWVVAECPDERTGKRVAVIGSGPAGLAAAQQLNRVGHDVVVFERDELAGGLMRYGIPDFKFAKFRLDRRLELLRQEGIEFRTGVTVGQDVTLKYLQNHYDAVCLCIGAQHHRDLSLPGRELQGIALGMDYLCSANRRVAGTLENSRELDARGKDVVVLGGGDTGADCVATAHRQGASSVKQISINPQPPDVRANNNPWPEVPNIGELSYALDEGGQALYALDTLQFVDTDADGCVDEIVCDPVQWSYRDGRRYERRVTGERLQLRANLVLVCIGFLGPDLRPFAEPGLKVEANNRIGVGSSGNTSLERVYAGGDAVLGQSLVVWAIASGRELAYQVDAALSGRSSLQRSLYTANAGFGFNNSFRPRSTDE